MQKLSSTNTSGSSGTRMITPCSTLVGLALLLLFVLASSVLTGGLDAYTDRQIFRSGLLVSFLCFSLGMVARKWSRVTIRRTRTRVDYWPEDGI